MKRLGKTILALGMTGALMLGTAGPALAAYDLYGDVKNPTIVYNDKGRQLNYVDLDNGAKTGRTNVNDEVAIYRKAILNNNRDWNSIAYNIFECDRNTYWDHAGKGWNKSYGTGHYIDFMYDMEHPRDGDRTVSHGLSVAGSLADVHRRAAEDLAHVINRKVSADGFLDIHKIDVMTDKSQTVLYSSVTVADRYGSTPSSGMTPLPWLSMTSSFMCSPMTICSLAGSPPAPLTLMRGSSASMRTGTLMI